MPYTEAEIRQEILNELAATKSGTLTISELIERLEGRLSPAGHDAEILDDRSDTVFSQKVRNTVSHRAANTSLESKGLAIYDPEAETWTITDAGRNLAKQI